MDCQNIEFSSSHSQQRITRLSKVFPPYLLNRILAFALYLLGAKRQVVAALVGMPQDSLKTMLRSLQKDGFYAFPDRRQKTLCSVAASDSPQQQSPRPRASLAFDDVCCSICFGSEDFSLKIPRAHQTHLRTILLSLHHAGMISSSEIASVLQITPARCRELSKKLFAQGVQEALVDKRQGQKSQLRVGDDEKSAILKHYVAMVVTGQSSSSTNLAKTIQDHDDISLSPRTIRYHANKLGLSRLKNTLPTLIDTLKKKLLDLLSNYDLTYSQSPLGFQTSRSITREVALVFAGSGYSLKTSANLAGCSISTVSRVLKPSSRLPAKEAHLPEDTQIYDEGFRLKMIGAYCQSPLPDNAGRWTLRWFAAFLKAHPEKLGASPSKSTIHRILKENKLKPHQSRYFLNITDPDFFPKMEHLVALYLDAPPHLYFFDECPGIQVLKRLAPDLRTEEMRKRLEEFEYIRNGTMNLLAFFNFADGKVYGECHADHKTPTFLATFRRHFATRPTDKPLHYVMDNLSTHVTTQFCREVASLSGVTCPAESELKTLPERYKWLKSTDKRIVIHFTPFHGSWLNLIEIWFGIIGKKVLRESYDSPEALKTAIEAFIEHWNDLLAHPFRWTYDGKKLHQKVVARFTQMLEIHVDSLDIRLLTKQLRLMKNLLKDYVTKITPASIKRLREVFEARYETLLQLIEREEGPVRKKNAYSALTSLAEQLQKLTCLHKAI